MINHLSSVQDRAKQTLQTLSLIDNIEQEWNQSIKFKIGIPKHISRCNTTEKDKKYRITKKENSQRQIKSIFVPKKIKFQDHPGSVENSFRARQYSTSAQRRAITRKTTQKNQSAISDRSTAQKLEKGNRLDYIKYWFQHRLQENSINGLIDKIREKRRAIRVALI